MWMSHQLQTFSLSLKALEKQGGRRGPGVDRKTVSGPGKEKESDQLHAGDLDHPSWLSRRPRHLLCSHPQRGGTHL